VNHLRWIHFDSVQKLREASADWDDLWGRCRSSAPTCRAELLAQWIEHFQPNEKIHVLAVADGSRWIAALPLAARRLGRLISAGSLPCNPWSMSGDLLLDPSADAESALDVLLASVAKSTWPMLWLNETVPEAPQWRAILDACGRAGFPVAVHPRYCVGRLSIAGTWEEYFKKLSKSHRQTITKHAKRLAEKGDVQFEMHSAMTPVEVEPWLRAAFEVEDLSWKGRAGTSVLRSPGMFSFFVRQAEQLARWGQLETADLRFNGRMISFLYGFRAHGVLYAHKIGYDPEFAPFSPGQLLFSRLIEHLHGRNDVHAMDCIGPLTEAVSRWHPDAYEVGRIAVGLRIPGRAMLFAYKHLWRRIRSFRPASAPSARATRKT